MRLIVKCFKHYADFKGRASLWEFVYFALFAVNCFLLLLAVGLYTDEKWAFLSALIAALFLITPSLAVTVRRLHDTGRNGLTAFMFFSLMVVSPVMWLYLVGAAFGEYGETMEAIFGILVAALWIFLCATLILSVVVLFLCLLKGQEGANKYGPAPDN